MSWEIVCPAVIVGWALLLWVLERRFPYDRQRLLRDGFWTDLVGYTLVQSYLMGLVIAALILWMDRATALSRLGLVSSWPLPAQVAFFVVTHDLYIYGLTGVAFPRGYLRQHLFAFRPGGPSAG